MSSQLGFTFYATSFLRHPDYRRHWGSMTSMISVPLGFHACPLIDAPSWGWPNKGDGGARPLVAPLRWPSQGFLASALKGTMPTSKSSAATRSYDPAFFFAIPLPHYGRTQILTIPLPPLAWQDSTDAPPWRDGCHACCTNMGTTTVVILTATMPPPPYLVEVLIIWRPPPCSPS
jgi:hypothetical protein